MTSIADVDLLQTLSNASIGNSAQVGSRPQPKQYAPQQNQGRTLEVSSEADIKAAAEKVAGGDYSRERPVPQSLGPAGVQRNQPLGQVINLLV